MRKLFVVFFCVSLIIPSVVFAMLSMELTRGMVGATPIAIVPFARQGGELTQDISSIIMNDLRNSGRFKVYGQYALAGFPGSTHAMPASYFRRLGIDNIVVGNVRLLSAGRYQVTFQLLDLLRTHDQGAHAAILSKTFMVTSNELRGVAHHMSDLIYQTLTGMRGIFSTKLAYIVVDRTVKTEPRYILEVSDQDGYNPRPLLDSPDPVMSPAWSPTGKQIAYVSFENQRAGIYLQEVATGNRRLISVFPGINGAPAWSPDGRKLALVLSKSGSPNIYMMDIASHRLTQLTHDWYINTEPAWSPDGRVLLFTSNRSGGPQIYQLQLDSGAISRVSYDGDYNARPSFTHDGKQVAFIHRTDGVYKIAILDLENGITRVLNKAGSDSASPSIAPNGSMVLYDTYDGRRNVLAMVSSDASIQLRLPARHGEAQDPAWSP